MSRESSAHALGCFATELMSYHAEGRISLVMTLSNCTAQTAVISIPLQVAVSRVLTVKISTASSLRVTQ